MTFLARGWLLCVLVGYGYGCGAFAPPNMAKQARAADASDTEKSPWVGRIDADLAPVADREEARSRYLDTTFAYLGVEGGKVCFRANYYSQYFRSHDTVDEIVELRRAQYEKLKVVFATYDSLDALNDQTPWPAATLNHVSDIQLIDKKVVKKKGSWNENTGKFNTSETLHTNFALCGAAPAFGPSTQYLTVSTSLDDKRALFMWKVEPNASRAPQPDAPPASDSPVGDSPPITTRTGKQDVIATLKAAGNYTVFLRALEATGVDATLMGPGPFTVFAPNDAAYAKLTADELELMFRETERERLTRYMRYHVIAGIKVIADIEKIAPGNLTTLEGPVFVRVKDKKLKPGTFNVGNAVGTKTAVPASNGLVYIVDQRLM